MRRLALPLALVVLASCGGSPEGEPLRITVPRGASLQQVTDTLTARGIVEGAPLFRAFVRIRRADRSIKAGIYKFRRGEGWGRIVDGLSAGRVVSVPMTIPEGWSMDRMVPRIAAATGLGEDTVRARLRADSAEQRWEVPGPGLEGYLFPDTYRFTPGASLDAVLAAMTGRYRAYWTPERRALLTGIGLDERAAVTLASIVQAEARKVEEMPTIAGVYLNRLRRGMRLEADPTVLYALGGTRPRLLFAAMDSVKDSPYNTYRVVGLPPGPIGAPGEAALNATLAPAEGDFVFFVARPDGSHVFTRTFAEHRRAVVSARREWDATKSTAIPRPPLDTTGAESR